MNLPPSFPGSIGIVITLLQVILTATSFSAETNANTRAKYSKFSNSNGSSNTKSNNTWPSRFAMMVIYTPALVTCLIFLALGSRIPRLPSPTFATLLCTIHFAKRCLEVMFLHKYSGSTDRATPTQIGVFYALVSILIAFGSNYSVNTISSAPSAEMYAMGTLCFIVGIIGNFYHHYLLQQLRQSSKNAVTTKYVAPKGGLFSYVATPHYFFELVGWLGIAMVSNQLNVYLVFTSMSSYLGGRSVAQNEFNKTKFDEKDWPRERKNLIPFVF
mmetsp:Transcript_30983/g.61758  ORF Transcript_30983/g.61758 Transcript_30983/m.61758 type:complete len:272 (+) Transcript_30983:123-938(+)